MHLDIAFGLLIGKYTSVEFFGGAKYIILLGIIFSLLPDLDFILEYASKVIPGIKNRGLLHRGIVHTPFFYILLALVLYILGINYWIIVMFLVGTLSHLLHDCFVLGRGVMIFFPFSKSRLKIFPDNGADGYHAKKIIWWNEEVSPLYSSVTTSVKSMHNKNWIHTWYMRPNFFLFGETALAILCLYLYSRL